MRWVRWAAGWAILCLGDVASGGVLEEAAVDSDAHRAVRASVAASATPGWNYYAPPPPAPEKMRDANTAPLAAAVGNGVRTVGSAAVLPPWPRAAEDQPRFGYPTRQDPLFDDGTRPAYDLDVVDAPHWDRPQYDAPDYQPPHYGLDPIRPPSYLMPLAVPPIDNKPDNDIRNYQTPGTIAPSTEAPVELGPNELLKPWVDPRADTPGYDIPIRQSPEYLDPVYKPQEYLPPQELPPPLIDVPQ